MMPAFYLSDKTVLDEMVFYYQSYLYQDNLSVRFFWKIPVSHSRCKNWPQAGLYMLTICRLL